MAGRSSDSLEEEGRALVVRLGGRWMTGGGLCRCPAHDDRTPSLSVRPGERRLLFHCFAGCETGRVIRALRALQLLGQELTAGDTKVAHNPVDPNRRNRAAA